MKTCYRCKESKPLELFRKNKRNKTDGLHSWCTPCFAEYERDRYQNGDRARKERNTARILKSNQDKLWAILSTNGCMDCGLTDPLVLEFDHRDPSIKEDQVTNMLRGSWSRLEKEIDKCDIVCCNCHRRRTTKMFGWWRGDR